MVGDKIDFFKNLNPDFFNYGSLPIYILKGAAQLIDFILKTRVAGYDGMLYLGRWLSIGFDLLTIIFIYKISKLLFKNEKVALFASFFYSVAFFPIQNSHFFVVDVFLTALTTILVYLLLLYLKTPTKKKIVLIAVIFSAMLATKFTAIIFFPVVIGVIIWKAIKQWNNLISSLFTFAISLLTFHFLFMPYAYIDFPKFLSDIKLQLEMNSNPYIFPFTLQYVGTTPYFYYLKNIFLWGLGPFISIISLIGLISLIRLMRNKKNNNMLFLFVFYFFYFLIVGRSSVKFMRYMLPLYPFFAVLAGYCMSKIKKHLATVFLFLSLLWCFIFVNIYSHPNTRTSATDWILKNIPAGSTLAVEHWDDRLPVVGGENYKYEELPLYERPDDDIKWQDINEKLKKSDYLIIASNRLYVPLQKLFDCNKYKSCYPKTSEYYKKLFSNKLSFRKAAEFSVSPKLEIGNWKLEIRDEAADESFTVYDHPKVMIYKNLH